MRTPWLCAASLCLDASYAFQNTSPFFAFSTLDRDFASPVHDVIVRSTDVEFLIQEIARACHTEAFVIFSQPGVTAEDYSSKDAAPSLQQRLEAAKAHKVNFAMPDVLGEVRRDRVLNELVTTCGMAQHNINVNDGPISIPTGFPQVLTVDLESPSTKHERRQQLLDNDRIFDTVLEGLEEHSFTVFYFTTPPSEEHQSSGSVADDQPKQQQHPQHLYDYDSEDALPEAYHSDLKRDLDSHVRRQAKNSTSSRAPLFETYNYFSPGIFMGLLATILLTSILYVGISAIGGMEVTYAAFSKEMGPAAQKKQQQ